MHVVLCIQFFCLLLPSIPLYHSTVSYLSILLLMGLCSILFTFAALDFSKEGNCFIFKRVCLEASGSNGQKSGDILTERSLSEEHESKSCAFVFQWPSNLIDPNQSLGIKANCITRCSCTSSFISYLFDCLTKAIRRKMKFKDFPVVLVCEYTWAPSLFGSLFLFVLLIAFHKATELS